MLKSKNINSNNGLWFMLVAAFCFSISGACTKVLGQRLSSIELVFFRNIIGVVFVLWSVFRRPLVQEGGKLSLLIFRGIIGTLALFTFFYSITKIGLAEAITYQQSYPIFLAVFSFYFFKEKLELKEWIYVLIGFFGICLIFIPQFKINLLSVKYHSFGLLNAIMTALAYLSISGLSKYYDSRSIVLSFMVSGIFLPLISLFLGQFFFIESLSFLFGDFILPIGKEWIWIFALSFSAMIGQIYLTKAFSMGKSGEVSAIGYSNIIFSIIFGVFLGDPFPSKSTFLGIGLIILCGILISFKKK